MVDVDGVGRYMNGEYSTYVYDVLAKLELDSWRIMMSAAVTDVWHRIVTNIVTPCNIHTYHIPSVSVSVWSSQGPIKP